MLMVTCVYSLFIPNMASFFEGILAVWALGNMGQCPGAWAPTISAQGLLAWGSALQTLL